MNERDLFHDGSKPTLTELGEMLTGQRPVTDPEALAAYRAEVEALWKDQPAFDFEVLRAASHRVVDEAPTSPASGRRRWWQAWALVPILALGLALLTLVPDNPGTRIKSPGPELSYFLNRGDLVMPAPLDAVLRAGDRIQFRYTGRGHETMVLIGVDGAGAVDLYYPSDPSLPPVAVTPTGTSLLDGSLELDATPGTETFVALFSPRSTAAAERRVRRAFEAGGHAALVQLADDDPDIAVVSVRKK